MQRVSSPDGRDWEVRIWRFRRPKWRHVFGYDEGVGGDYEAAAVEAAVYGFVIPLLAVVVELPIAYVRGFFSSKRWIEAFCPWPREIRMVWETSRQDAERDRDYIVRRLGEGYEDLTPAGASMVDMTNPGGYAA